jgi:hypothetical protein
MSSSQEVPRMIGPPSRDQLVVLVALAAPHPADQS